MRELSDLVAGRHVALVGNADSILRRDDGLMIEAHDIVIRMNAGYPRMLRPASVGFRTDVWATAKPFLGPPTDTKIVLFMKLTALGDKHWPLVKSQAKDMTCIRWEQALEDECRQFVGADPGTGIRLLWWLKKHAKPTSVNCYGMDCWKTNTHWSGLRNTPNHVPSLEQSAMDKLLDR